MRSWKIVLGTTAALAVVAAGYLSIDRGAKWIGNAAGAETSAPPPAALPVPVASVVKKTVPIYLEYPARTESIRDVTLQAKVSGYIQAQQVADGTDVKAGDLLYTIDPRDFQAALDQTKAQAQRDVAALDYARSNLDRGEPLAKMGYLDKNSFDQRTSAVRQAEAALAMDQAAIRTAELNIGYTEIRAPFAGRLGRNQAPIGTLISVAGAPLNTLVQLDPIYVTFDPSETDLAEIQKARASHAVEAEVFLPGQGEASHKGEVTFVDNAVDRATGTITVRATIGNADFALLPGQYVRVRLHVKERPDALLVPQTALGSSQLGKYVYVIGKDGKAEQRLVSVGPADGDLVVVDGVSEGDRIITGNLQKIGPGAPVQALAKDTASKS